MTSRLKASEDRLTINKTSLRNLEQAHLQQGTQLEAARDREKELSERLAAVEKVGDEQTRQLQAMREKESKLEATIQSLQERGAGEIRKAQAEAVKEYRLSKDCFQRKEAYASGFSKYGFYQARSWLEHERPGQSFPELVYTDEASTFPCADWDTFEPGCMSMSEYFAQGLEDDLSNLDGPWSPLRGPDSEVIGALADLDDPSFQEETPDA